MDAGSGGMGSPAGGVSENDPLRNNQAAMDKPTNDATTAVTGYAQARRTGYPT